MGWFTKKEDMHSSEQMPELPELPDSPNTNLILPQSSNQQPQPNEISLPQQNYLPQTPAQKLTKDFSESTNPYSNQQIRPGMQKSKFSLESEVPEIPEQTIENFGVTKIKDSPYMPPQRDVGMIKTQGSFKPSTKSLSKKDDSVYIRLDKFQITMESFREIKNKIREIEELLARTKEIKVREEKEIEEWEREIEAIKLKLGSIDKEISAPEE